MRITAKAVINRVQLRTIIIYAFMLYGSRRFRGRISRSASLTASTKTRLEFVAHLPRSRKTYSVSSASNDNWRTNEHRAPGGNLRQAARTLLKFARNGVFCLRRQYTLGTPLPLAGRLRASETEKPPLGEPERRGVVI